MDGAPPSLDACNGPNLSLQELSHRCINQYRDVFPHRLLIGIMQRRQAMVAVREYIAGERCNACFSIAFTVVDGIPQRHCRSQGAGGSVARVLDQLPEAPDGHAVAGEVDGDVVVLRGGRRHVPVVDQMRRQVFMMRVPCVPERPGEAISRRIAYKHQKRDAVRTANHPAHLIVPTLSEAGPGIADGHQEPGHGAASASVMRLVTSCT